MKAPRLLLLLPFALAFGHALGSGHVPDPRCASPSSASCTKDRCVKFVPLSDDALNGSTPSPSPNDFPNLCQPVATDVIDCDGAQYTHARLLTPSDGRFYLFLGLSLCLIVVAGLMSGLQLGLLAVNTNTLQVMSNAGTPKEQKLAKKISALVKRRHLLLVALLVANAACLEALPLFLDMLLNPVMNILVSVTAVLFFGEIIPQAICVRYGLAIGSALSWVVWGMIGLTFPIAWPLSKLLDFLLGNAEGHFFRREELKELMHMQQEQGTGETKLTQDEATIINGALEMTTKTVACCMTPLADAFMLDRRTVINRTLLQQIQIAGKSRIPIHDGDRNCIRGMLLAKGLLGVDTSAGLTVEERMQPMPSIYVGKLLFDCLREFQEGKIHIAAVHNSERPNIVDGIVTLEDIIEQLLGTPIKDEMDVRTEIEMRHRTLGRLVSARFGSQHHEMLGHSAGLLSQSLSSSINLPGDQPQLRRPRSLGTLHTTDAFNNEGTSPLTKGPARFRDAVSISTIPYEQVT